MCARHGGAIEICQERGASQKKIGKHRTTSTSSAQYSDHSTIVPINRSMM